MAVERFAEPRAAPDMEENGRLLERVNFHFLFSNFRFLFLFLMPNCFPERDGDLGVYNGCIFC